MNTLYAIDIRIALNHLCDMERRVAEIHTSSPEHYWRCCWLTEDLRKIRDTLLRASCADVAVEQTEAA